ncbi:IMEF encapsulin system ferritin-like cargo protein [Bacillus thermotolerans]|uniref:Ferritin-like protein n=2 Tax=Bacillus thermotolerans TaxID=1221996 RepID=IMEF_BACTR|nr:IMEF encapsulin system ferritin-like cargo protein [Bacillus thermotolerans]A0A0F5HNH9.1 RecName: Full=Ferritin-like protein; AltName: Full=IMEF cargo protein [Bacillus thermotolerans]KKB33990.1 hypothetical protein QY96_00287 [Bacillus thermotolerans]KKB34808.1 hypothetical protein QY97_02116 [Bacillus thermotolerans]KKB43348.1 hypothetical protein QY95_01593 [Bacillus thermotolerans]
MKEELDAFHQIFTTTKEAIERFMAMLTPVIENAEDDHERLYYHHIYEEEEQRLSRLDVLIPLIEKFQDETDEGLFSPSNNAFNRLLQELNLEKFGLHNFIEHVDLALFSFTDEERQTLLKELRKDAYEGYQYVKEKLAEINARFDHDYADPHAHHDEHRDHLADMPSAGSSHEEVQPVAHKKKGFTVGSLIQ